MKVNCFQKGYWKNKFAVKQIFQPISVSDKFYLSEFRQFVDQLSYIIETRRLGNVRTHIRDLLFRNPLPPSLPVCSTPPPPVTNYMLLYSTLLCKKIARAPGGVKNKSPLRWGPKPNTSHIRFRPRSSTFLT